VDDLYTPKVNSNDPITGQDSHRRFHFRERLSAATPLSDIGRRRRRGLPASPAGPRDLALELELMKISALAYLCGITAFRPTPVIPNPKPIQLSRLGVMVLNDYEVPLFIKSENIEPLFDGGCPGPCGAIGAQAASEIAMCARSPDSHQGVRRRFRVTPSCKRSSPMTSCPEKSRCAGSSSAARALPGTI
jgi:hypothetical protein